MALRELFPVLAAKAYLNAGTCGPIPAPAVAAAREALEVQAAEGRYAENFRARVELRDRQRAAYARLLGCAPERVALTSSTSEGIGVALAAMRLGPGDVVVTSDEEHPGLLGPVLSARRSGAAVRVAPFARVADAVEADTTVVACSHVSWASGLEIGRAVAEAARAAGAAYVLDGAQGVGAVPVDPAALACNVYAGSGQKWLCGPDGTGMLYVSPAARERLDPSAPGYSALADPNAGLDSDLHPDARAFDGPGGSRESAAFAVAALAVLEEHGFAALHRAAADRAEALAAALRERGREVVERGRTTLVAWREEDAAATRARLAAAGVVVRDLPGRGLVRASVGAWNDERDLERLLGAL